MSLSNFEKDVINHLRDEVVFPWSDTKLQDMTSWDAVTLLLDDLHKDRKKETEKDDSFEDLIRKYIFKNEKDILKYTIEGRNNGNFSEKIFEQRMTEPIVFLQSVEKECATSLLQKTSLSNMKNFALDENHCAMIFDVLSDIENNMELMKKEKSFQNACYEVYRRKWLRDNGSSLADERDIIDTIYREEHKDDATFTRPDAKALYMMYEGIDGNGTIYASQSEFLNNDYQNASIMHIILPKQMRDLYDAFQCVVSDENQEEKNVSVVYDIPMLSEEDEQKTLSYLQSLPLDKAVNQTFIQPFELLQKIGVDEEHMDDCETLLQSTRFSRLNGHFSMLQEKIVPVVFDKEMKEEFSYVLQHFDKEKEFICNENDFKKNLFDNYCMKNFGVLVGTSTKHYDKFLREVYTDNQRMKKYLTFSQQMLKDRYDGIPYKEKENKTFFIKNANRYVNSNHWYHWDAGKAWRDIELHYEGKDKQRLFDRVSQVTSRFRQNLDVPMVESGLVFKDGYISQEGMNMLRSVSKKYFGKVMQKDKEIEK